MNPILVLAETTGDQLRPASLEAVTAAKQIAGATGAEIVAAVASDAPRSSAESLAATGISRVLTVAHPTLATFSTDSALAAAEAVIAAVDPGLVLLPGTTSGRDYAPALAARLGAIAAADAIQFDVVEGKLTAVRPVYGGKMLSRVDLPGDGLSVVTIRPGAFEKASSTESGAGIESLQVEIPDPRVRFEGLHQDSGSGARNLEEAEIIVSGGRGLKEPENFAVVEHLAAALDGVVGASRAVVDAGWRKHHEQVGQTGRSVSPRLYVAVGISGAVQHVVGMQGSEFIVAINRDPDAPIFRIASFGIVGDLFDIVPAIVSELAASA
ncbi:MAG: electron transfer flavoprotein subunit alpha/FixB family protein [Thermomicrobiales bacterium]